MVTRMGEKKDFCNFLVIVFFYHFSKHFVFTRSDDEIDAKENEAGKGSKTHQGNEKTENYALKNHADTLVMARLQSQRHQNAQTTKFE